VQDDTLEIALIFTLIRQRSHHAVLLFLNFIFEREWDVGLDDE
jgi:hypothetical protein